MSTRYEIIREKANYLVNMGVYESIAEAWDEAQAICEESDAFEVLYRNENKEDEE